MHRVARSRIKDKDLLARAAEIGALKGKLTAELDKERKAKVELQTEVKVLTTSLNTERATAKSPTDPGKRNRPGINRRRMLLLASRTAVTRRTLVRTTLLLH